MRKKLENFKNILLINNTPCLQFWKRFLIAKLILIGLNFFVSIWILVYQTIHHPSHLPYIFRKGSKDVKENSSKISWNAIGDLIVIGIIFTLYCWSLWAISYKIRKLDFPAISKFEEHIESLQQHEYENLSNNLKYGLVHEKNANDKMQSLEIPGITLKLVKSYIINPMDIKLDFRQPIAQGQFGLIYKGSYLHNKKLIDIVTKVGKDNEEQSNSLNILIQEIKILIHVGNDHENIVTFYGITSSLHFKDNYGIVNEYCALGNLEDYLKSKHPNVSETREFNSSKLYQTVDISELKSFALQICRGMEFLASKKVVHGDLSTRNVLLKQSLTNNLCVKITDFGLARRLYNYQIYAKQSQHVLLPWRWMSIEAIEDLKFSEKSDVWSFGVTMWELFSNIDEPYSNINWSTDFPQLLRSGLRLKKPTNASLQIFKIMESCWNIQEILRPNFSQLVTTLLED